MIRHGSDKNLNQSNLSKSHQLISAREEEMDNHINRERFIYKRLYESMVHSSSIFDADFSKVKMTGEIHGNNCYGL